MALLHGTGVRLGLVTNGEQWMLVDAPRSETTGFVTWHARLWLEEPLTLRAFTSLLGAHMLFGRPENASLEALLTASASDQQELTDQLGLQVRQAVELLVSAIDAADRERDGALAASIQADPAFARRSVEEVIYEAALTVMMRLVFLLSAEEQGVLLPEDGLPVEPERNIPIIETVYNRHSRVRWMVRRRWRSSASATVALCSVAQGQGLAPSHCGCRSELSIRHRSGVPMPQWRQVRNADLSV